MSRWVQVHLDGGVLDGEPIIAPGTLKEMHSPQMVIPGMPREPHVSPTSYGLGWFTDTWQGHYRVHHGGNIDGFSARVTLFPNDGVGVVILVNKGGSPLPALLTAVLADRALGIEDDDRQDWLGRAAERRDAGEDFVREGQENKALFRVENTRPSRKPAAFTGRYEHPGYGILEVESDGKKLTMVYNGMVMPLEHWHYDVFNVAESDEDVIPEDLKVNFLTDDRGRLSRLSVPFEPLVDPIVFRRLPDARLSDPAFLARLAGDYEVPNQTLTFALKGDVLVLQVTGQPAVELVPTGTDEFTLDGLTGFDVKFVIPETGPATEAIFIQPNGVFPATRKVPGKED